MTLGRNSLIVCVTGLVAIESCVRTNVVAGPIWTLLQAGFEAGTIGALADWFAVTALFRRVPLPLLGRHTNIIVRNRARLTKAIVEMVETKWLTPEAVAERLAKFSLSQALIRFFANDENRERAVRAFREVAGSLAARLDPSAVAEFLREVIAAELPRLRIARPLGAWLKEAIVRGDQAKIWSHLLDLVGAALAEPDIRALVESHLAQAARSYKDQGLIKKLFVGAAEHLGGFDYRDAAAILVERARQVCVEARDDEAHPVRRKFDEVLADFATALERDDPKASGTIAALQQRIADSPRLHPFLQAVLERLQAVVTHQAVAEDSPLAILLEGSARRLVEVFTAETTVQSRVDDFFRSTVANLVREHHAVIGDIVAASLDPRKLSDAELIEQIESRIGDDLQYIRLNGAVVGGLVGIIIAAIKLTL